ncbi:MAG TPA: hypothetical protein VK694_04085 [Verrucomicrobiae bacterium]|nr:hypothetical protein [Verrucomicrobiae bacterium]
MTALQPMAFFHEDGLVAAWKFAGKYAGPDGHIATLPEIVEARLATERDNLPWRRYFTTNSAEYYGMGTDGRQKLIVAHGVGPMASLEGIKRAYSWEYKDTDRRRRGGRISAKEFLRLEAGDYGEVTVIDFRDYLEQWGDSLYSFRTTATAQVDTLLMARLGPKAGAYLLAHDRLATQWHQDQSVEIPGGSYPIIVQNDGAANCSYTTYPRNGSGFDWSRMIPRSLEPGKAMGHLLSTSGLAHMHSSDSRGHWQGLTNDVSCHEWWNGVRLVSTPPDATWQDGVVESPEPRDVLRHDWQRFMRPNDDAPYTPPRLYLIEQAGVEWFTRYSKPSKGDRLDSGDIEFRVRSVRAIGDTRQFKVDDDFFLRYNLSQVVAITPEGANAYNIVHYGPPDGHVFTTVTVQFYEADVDTSQRLPPVKEIKQDYKLLMG